jgi:hypothetical protein
MTGRPLAGASAVTRLVLAAALVASAAPARAADVEVHLLAGKVFPFYEQTFTYDPGQLSGPLPGSSISQESVFRLEARGALALSGAVAVRLVGPLGLEGRIDTADVSVETEGARYRVRAPLPAPLPSLSTTVDLGNGSVDLARLHPLSLNLRLSARGDRLGGGISGGVSWLPSFEFELDQRLSVNVPLLGGGLDLIRLRLPASASPEGEGEGRLGANVGAFGTLAFNDKVALVVDARWFYFKQQTLDWGTVTTSLPLPSPYREVVGQIVEGLEPVEFNPTFFDVTVGIAFRF